MFACYPFASTIGFPPDPCPGGRGRYHRPQEISATTVLPAVAGFVVVHRAVLTALLAALRRGLGRKRACANSCRQNRKQNFRVRLHTLNLPREMN
jgi:hypothetical protein